MAYNIYEKNVILLPFLNESANNPLMFLNFGSTR